MEELNVVLEVIKDRGGNLGGASITLNELIEEVEK